MTDITQDFLTELLDKYWFAPPVALWRAVELRIAAEEQYARPVLDLGCGDGLIGEVLFGSDSGVDVGVDPWLDQVRQAARSGVYRRVDLASGQHLPYQAGAFATVFSNSVLEHIEDVESVVREVGRVLRRGGRFVFTVPSDAFRSLLDGAIRRQEAGDPAGAQAYAASIDEWLAHFHYHTPDQWADILGRAGMSLVKARYYIPKQVERLWDRMNGRFGVQSQWSVWSLLVSPRLRSLGYQSGLRKLVVSTLSRRWRSFYEMDVPAGEQGGGLLIVGKRGA
jgi:SAM-dependent methyltransferase